MGRICARVRLDTKTEAEARPETGTDPFVLRREALGRHTRVGSGR